MKIFFTCLMLLLAIPLTLQSQWIKLNDYEMLKKNTSSLNDFVISPEGKNLYLLYENGLLEKRDYESGDSLSSIVLDSLYHNKSSVPSYFLSSDGKTFIISTYFKGYTNIIVYNYIYDIDKIELVDSLVASFYLRPENHGSMSETFITKKCDYVSDKKLMFVLNSYNVSNYWHYDDVSNRGAILVAKRMDTAWVNKILQYENPLNNFYDNNLFFWQYNWYGSRMNMHTKQGSMGAGDGCILYNFSNDKRLTVSYHKYYQGSYGQGNEGYTLPVGSVLIFNDLLYVLAGNTLKTFATDSIRLLNTIEYKEYNSTDPISLKLNLDSTNYIISLNNSFNIHKYNNHFRFLRQDIDSASTLTIFRKNPVSNDILFSDTRGSLFKVSYKNIIKLRSNFITVDSLFNIGDTVLFSNRSIGNPKEYFWDFGDGTTSTEKNPYHIYRDSGYYVVKLVITRNSIEKDSSSKIIHIIHKITPDFSYSRSSIGDTIVFQIRNLSKITYDSLHWEILNKSLKWERLNKNNFSADTVVYKNLKYFNYWARLVLYKFNRPFSTVKKLYTDYEEEPLSDSIVVFEHIDTSYSNYEALKGFFDSDNGLIYQVKGADCRYGFYKSFKSEWSVNLGRYGGLVFKRNNGLYSFANNQIFYNFDNKNNISSKNTNIPKLGSTNITCNGAEIVYTDISIKPYLTDYLPHRHSYYIFNQKNEQIKTGEILTTFEDMEIYNFVVRETENYLDYAFFVKGALYDNNHQPYAVWITVINHNYSIHIHHWLNFTDFTRLNNNTLVLFYNDRFYIYNTETKEMKEYIHENVFFKNIKRINEKYFIIAGSANGHPAYWIFNTDGLLNEKHAFKDRFGAFNYVDVSEDNRFLFSGWRYKTFPVKNPYYLESKFNNLDYKKIVVDFKYNIDYSQDTTKISIKNTTKANIDSLHWKVSYDNINYLVNADNPKANSIELATIFDRTYKVKLTIFVKNFSFSKQKVIKVEVPERQIFSGIYIYDFTDTAHLDYEAVKGYEDKFAKSLCYQIHNKIGTIYALRQNDSLVFAKIIYGLNNYLFRLDKNIYFFNYSFFYGYLFNIYYLSLRDLYFRIINANHKITYNNSSLVIILEHEKAADSIKFYIYRDLDEPLKKEERIIPLDKNITKIYNATASSYNNLIDYLCSYSYNKYIGYKKVSLDTTTLNGQSIKFTKFIDFVRLNEENLIIFDTTKILAYKYTSSPEFISEKNVLDWRLTSIYRVNGSFCILTGEKNGHPGYLLIDSLGYIVWENVFNTIWGRFNSVFKSYDNNLLFSGYRFTNYDKKYPYFLKVKSPIDNLEKVIKSDNASNIYLHYCYPNPITRKGSLRILSQEETDVQISFYDCFGNLIMKDAQVHLVEGLNNYDFDVGNIAIGTYYYTINSRGEMSTGKFIIMK